MIERSHVGFRRRVPAPSPPRFLRNDKIGRNCALLAVVLAFPALGTTPLNAEGFSTKTAPTLTTSRVMSMECRYYTELLGIYSKSSMERQLEPIIDTEVDTVICCPSGWRFFNFPSSVDLTWKEPGKHPRNHKLYPNWNKMVDNLATGGDPLKDALESTRRLKKQFVISCRMNDNHYVHIEEFPTHNNFWREHPEYRLGNDSNAYSLSDGARIFNYLVPEVRDFYFSVLEELCTKYDVDGVELDFQRAPRFFHDAEVDRGRAVMTAYVKRIREMMDRIGEMRGRHLRLCVRVMHTVKENDKIGLDVLAWDAAGWLDGITVSSGYAHTADVGIEGFVDKRNKARVYGELNYLSLQVDGTGHDAKDRRYLTPEAYRAATLSYLERGADGVSFFNTYCIPQPMLGKLTANLLRNYKDLDLLQRSDKDYISYATGNTMFGRVFPARDERAFDMFVADEMPGYCKRAVLRFETKAPCQDCPVEAWVNGVKLSEYATHEAELFPPVMINKASPKEGNLKFFAVSVETLRFGINRVEVRNADRIAHPCLFVSAELALYMK